MAQRQKAQLAQVLLLVVGDHRVSGALGHDALLVGGEAMHRQPVDDAAAPLPAASPVFTPRISASQPLLAKVWTRTAPKA